MPSMPRLAYLLSFLVSLAVAVPCNGQSKAEPQQQLTAPPTVQLVGLLTKQYRGRCGADGQHKWDDEHWEVGFVRLEVPDTVDLSALEGKAVVVMGTPAAAAEPKPVEVWHEAATLNPKPEGPGIECPAYQMRSDWVIGKNGFRIMRSRAGNLPARLVVQKAELFSGIDLQIRDDDLVVTATNTFGKRLGGLDVKLHYEGCYGKPGTDTRTHLTLDVGPGKQVVATFPKIVGEDQGKWGIRHHRAYSIQLMGKGEDVLFDCDLPLSLFKAEGVDCPQESK